MEPLVLAFSFSFFFFFFPPKRVCSGGGGIPFPKLLFRFCFGYCLPSWLQSCQAEQARIINQLFGVVSGREQTLPQQVAAFIDNYKDLVLRGIIPSLFESAFRGCPPF